MTAQPTHGRSPAVQVEDLRKGYGDKVAVHDVSFEVGTGEVFGILGPNGAGKTTTVESIAGLRVGDAGASRVGVTLYYDGDEVVLDVRDDGTGFDLSAPATASSFGLRGMRQRAERLTGRLVLESRPGSGTAVSVRLPKLAREAA